MLSKRPVFLGEDEAVRCFLGDSVCWFEGGRGMLSGRRDEQEADA
jgi:hypothetical protein